MNYDLLQTTNDPSAFKQFYIIKKYYNTGELFTALFSSRCPKNFENEKIFLCLKIQKKHHLILFITPEKQDKTLELSKH